LKDHFRQAGQVTYANVDRDRPQEGVVEFSTGEDMKEAMRSLNGQDFKGNELRLREANPSSSTPAAQTRSERSRSPVASAPVTENGGDDNSGW